MSEAKKDVFYGIVLEKATRYALRHLDDDRASDLAHDVAAGMLRRISDGGAIPDAERELNAMIYRAVINRLIDVKRANSSRAAAENVHATDLAETAQEWNNPSAIVEANELAAIMREAIAAMPPRMRRVFLLVRDHDQGYQDVAAALGVGIGTVHTQMSRAYALLRDTIERYRSVSGEQAGAQSSGINSPVNRKTKP